jgi:hypothetical protein
MMLTLKQVTEDPRDGLCVGREVPACHCAEATRGVRRPGARQRRRLLGPDPHLLVLAAGSLRGSQ